MKIACIQLKSSSHQGSNIKQVLRLSERAVVQGASLIAFPEHFNYIGKEYRRFQETIPGDTTKLFSAFAKKHRVAFILGTLPEVSPRRQKVYNTSVVIDKQGKIIAKYRKRKLFQARLHQKRNKKFDENIHFTPGKKQAPVFKIEGFKIGLGICFDIRFPELFEHYRKEKVDILILPSAFTYQTGKNHWQPLLTARAIEGLCYVIAPNQYGDNPYNGVKYYGRSLVLGPWGQVIKQGPLNKSSILIADIQKAPLKTAREKILLS